MQAAAIDSRATRPDPGARGDKRHSPSPRPLPPARPSAMQAAARGWSAAAYAAAAGLRSFALGQGIAKPAYVANRFRAELSAQMMDVHLDRVAFHFFSPAVQALLELCARQNGAGTLQQRG